MEFTPAEIIDRLTITKLKIERIGEEHLNSEYKAYKKAIEDFEKKGIKINEKWIESLYEINGKIWDQEFKVRQIANKLQKDPSYKFSDEELSEIGSRYLKVGKFMAERVKVKNDVTENTKIGFAELKKDHCAEE